MTPLARQVTPGGMSRTPEQNSEIIRHVVETIHRLRAPGGCPWDREQTHHSLRQYLIEEAYETLDVLDQIDSPEKLKDERIRGAFREEMGDVLLQILLHSEMAREQGAFDFYDVAQSLAQKMISRHPHVFGDADAKTSEQVLQNWEKLKAAEKAKKQEMSVLDGLPKGLPALQKAARTIEKVTRVGFQWPDMQGPLAKAEEELHELKAEVLNYEKLLKDLKAAGKKESAELEQAREKLADELGDVFFTLANLAHLTKISPEDALRRTLQRFERRFRHVEKRLQEQGRKPEQATLQEMDVFWDEAKRLEKK